MHLVQECAGSAAHHAASCSLAFIALLATPGQRKLLEPLGDKIFEVQMKVVPAKEQVEALDWELRMLRNHKWRAR